VTTQIGDTILYNGKAYFLGCEPLSDHLERLGLKFQWISTAEWRGYRAQWEIINEKLYLIKFSGYLGGLKFANLKQVFKTDDKVFASWFSDTLIIHSGEPIIINDGYGTVFEKHIYIDCKDGVVINESVSINTKSR
jgi:hypothetical protein